MLGALCKTAHLRDLFFHLWLSLSPAWFEMISWEQCFSFPDAEVCLLGIRNITIPPDAGGWFGH